MVPSDMLATVSPHAGSGRVLEFAERKEPGELRDLFWALDIAESD